MSTDIGYCECCGCVDHHRVNGLCAHCLYKTKTIEVAGNKHEHPLGYEAANTATINNFEGVTNAPRH